MSFSTMLPTNTRLPSGENAAPCDQWPMGASAKRERSMPLTRSSTSLPASAKKGESLSLLLPIVTLPAGVTVLPWIVKTDTVPSPRLATSARVPWRVIETPAGFLPVSSVAMTFGGVDVRSTTDIVLLGIRLVGSLGSSFSLAVTSASDSSGVTATLKGGPTTLPGTSTSAITFGGQLLMSMTVNVSGGGLFTTVATPLTSVTLLSLVESKSCPCAAGTRTSTASRTTTVASRGGFIGVLPIGDGRRIEDQVPSTNARYTAPHDSRSSVDHCARPRRCRDRRARHRLAAYAAAVSAQPHQPVAARGRRRLDHHGHGCRARRHARPVGAHLRDAPRRPARPSRARHAFPSGPHRQRGLAHGAVEDRALVHAGGVALRAVRLAQPRGGRLRAAPRAFPASRLRPRGARAARPARQSLSEPRARGADRVPAHPRGRFDHDRPPRVSRAGRAWSRARARVPLGRGRPGADRRRSGASEDHDQRQRLVRAALAQSTPALSRLARPLPADVAGHAGAAVARPAVSRPARAARPAARPSRGASGRGAGRAGRAAYGGRAGPRALAARARQPSAELCPRRSARAPALPRGRGARGPPRGRRWRPPVPQGLTVTGVDPRVQAKDEGRYQESGRPGSRVFMVHSV